MNYIFFPSKTLEGLHDDHHLSNEPLGLTHITALGTHYQICRHDPLCPGLPLPAETGYQASKGQSLLLTLALVLVDVHGVIVHSMSRKGKATSSEHPAVGSKTQEPHQILFSPWLS